MHSRSFIRPFALASLAVVAASSFAQGDPNVVDKILAEGKYRNQALRRLKELTDMGPRVTGSPTILRAQNWAMAQFKKFGCVNVRLEKYGEAPVGFERGPVQIGRMVSPFKSDFQFTTMNWMPGTNGPVKAKAVMAPKTMEEFAQVRESLKGAWVVVESSASMRGVEIPNDDLKKAIDEVGIAGRILGSRDERVTSHGTWRDKTYENRPKDLNIIVRRSDHDRIIRNIRFGRDVQLEFNLQNRWFKGPVPLYNVVADFPGTEKPNELVLVGGHIDSWNSPGSQGACDNGTGTVAAIEAARLLHVSGAKPKRTIRFVLWSGEEQGLLGSRGYVETHKDEMERISAVLNDDGGTGYQGGYVGLEIWRSMMETAFAPTARAFPELPMEYRVVERLGAGGGSDHASYQRVGVPAFFTIEKGDKADYGKVWHTQFDRFEEAVPEYLVQASTNHAVVAYNLACAPTLLPRPAPAPAGE